MELSTELTDGIVRPRPFSLDDVGRVSRLCANRWAIPGCQTDSTLKMIRSVPGEAGFAFHPL